MSQELSTISIEASKKGEESAYKQLFFNYFEPLTFFANKYLNDMELSKDMVQGIFSHIYEKREELKISSSIKSYLYQSVANRSLNQLKSSKIHAEHHADIKHRSEDGYVEEQMELTELEVKIAKTIDQLPDQCKRIFKLSRYEHKSNQEIADELEISKRTVETQISKALKVLRASLKLIILEFFLNFF
jgi:RNA polymerase sigma-70 factor (ECF subfamily)